MRKLILLILMCCVLTSCGIFKGGNFATVPKHEGNNPPTRTPPGSSISFTTLYPISERSYPAPKSVDITPPGLVASPRSSYVD